MTDQPIDEAADDRDLSAVGARVRSAAPSLDAGRVPVAVLGRRARRRGALAGVFAALVVVMGIAFALDDQSGTTQLALGHDRVDPAKVDAFLASLPDRPVDPTRVELVSTVASFPGCEALIGNLRTVGAKHVGSRGFGHTGVMRFQAVGDAIAAEGSLVDSARTASPEVASGTAGGATLGTNVQVSGVDELDHVKAEGSLIYDLDGRGNLRITDADTLKQIAILDVTSPVNASKGEGSVAEVSTSATSLLVSKGHIVVFGAESDVSKPVPGDPSAAQSATNYLTVVFVDATDAAHPKVTDRVKVEGSLVAARLVGGQIRLVTTSHMADIGMVMPTTRASIPTALERNRRSVAISTAADWIPDWQRSGGKPQPLVPCDRVNVPETFAGVAMTSMVTFPLGSGRFDPAGTSIVAPSTTLYAGLDKVAISSHVWVDPVDRQRLHFDDWRTAIHEFTFPKTGAPTYIGSGIVSGSTIGQFAFGEVGDAISVVTTKGTPWTQNPKAAVDLTLLTADGKGQLGAVAQLKDLADGNGQVTAVRYLADRILISTGIGGRDVQVVDVTDPTSPRRAGKVTLAGPTGYFHPLGDGRALLVGSRHDTVPGPDGPIGRSWVRAELLNVSNADAPKILGSWELPWSTDEVGSDHHAFTYWPERHLAMWGVRDARYDSSNPNHAIVLDVATGVTKVAMPVASKPPAVAPPCPQVPIDDAQLASMLGPGSVVLGCGDTSRKRVEWPRYLCSAFPKSLVKQYAPEKVGDAKYFGCHPAPEPTVSRVLVVDGTPMLLSDQTLEALDPRTFDSTSVVYHPRVRATHQAVIK